MKKHEWVEENITLNKSKSNLYIGSSFNEKKFNYLLVFLLICFSLIIIKIFYLQIIKGGQYRDLAEKNRQRIIPIASERGVIYDRKGEALTENIPSFSLAIVPQDLPKKKEAREPLITKLSALSGKNEVEIRKILDEYSKYVYESIVIQENLDYDTALKIIIQAADLPGIQIQNNSKRRYINYTLSDNDTATSTPFSLSHIIGYMGKLSQLELNNLYGNGYFPSDYLGKYGVEKEYEKELRGVYGRKRIEVNSVGKEQLVLAEEAPIPGKHLKLSIDLEMQKALENIMQRALKNSNKSKASGIVMDPNNGQILAMVNLPTFDNNDFSGGISYKQYQSYLADKNNPLFNRSVSGLYPSGSVIKPAIAAAALQEKIITPETSFLSNGGLRIGSWFFPDWKAGGHGITNVRKAIAWSVNTFFYYIGGGYKQFNGMGVEKITEYLKKFGFSKKVGIDLPGEVSGFLPTIAWKEEKKKEPWYIGDTYNYSIGQGDILVTPLQIAVMTSAVANGGTLYTPRIGKEFVDPITKTRTEIKSKIINQNFIDPSKLEVVRFGMRDCVVYGSCRQLNTLPNLIAGKTGTAQWNANKGNHAWFTSFAPFDKPKIVVTILVEEGVEGSAVAVPIAYEFYKLSIVDKFLSS